MKRISYLLAFLLFTLASSLRLAAQETTEETGDVVLRAAPQNKNAIFKSTEEVRYKIQVSNKTNSLQRGKISYLVTTDEGKRVFLDSVKLNLKSKASKDLVLTIPKKQPDFTA